MPTMLLSREEALKASGTYKNATILKSSEHKEEVTFRLFDVRDAHYELDVQNARSTLHQDHVAWVSRPCLADVPVLHSTGLAGEPEAAAALQRALWRLTGSTPSETPVPEDEQTKTWAMGSVSKLLKHHEDLLKEVYKPKGVCIFFNPIYRQSRKTSAGAEIGAPVPAVGHLHSDFSVDICLMMLKARKLPAERHYKMVSVWVPLRAGGHPPLAAVPSSRVNHDHIKPMAAGLLGFSAKSQEALHEHALWYLSDQKPDEVTILELFDSKEAAAAQSAGHQHIGVQHGAPHVEGIEVETRESIEVRALIQL